MGVHIHVHTPVSGHLCIMTKDDFGAELINIYIIINIQGRITIEKKNQMLVVVNICI